MRVFHPLEEEEEEALVLRRVGVTVLAQDTHQQNLRNCKHHEEMFGSAHVFTRTAKEEEEERREGSCNGCYYHGGLWLWK